VNGNSSPVSGFAAAVPETLRVEAFVVTSEATLPAPP